MSNRVKLYNSARYPTSLIVRGADELGIEIAKSLLEQGGYVIIIDELSPASEALLRQLDKYKLLTVLDYSAVEVLDTELRRLDYVFYFQHKASNLTQKVSSQEFLQFSNYLDTVLDLSTKFEAKFLLTTSIKAHQLNVANKTIDVNYSPENDDRHTSYTELEIQRYAESLVKEYQEKVGLDARILRLGIILGKSFDPQDKSILYKLIFNALNGDDLVIPGDGLDSDYYVHYLDCAYGLIKAQFSMNTSGKIFSLCNEEQLSILSIAYKIVDIVPEASEIRFDPNDNDLPGIKLYKPAPNLAEVGWKARVSFDRALAQTIDEVRDISSQQKVDDFISKENAKTTKTENVHDSKFGEPKDALAKLIAERKTQESARVGSIILANKNKKESEKLERNKGFFKRIDISFNNFLFALKRRLTFLKNMTVTDFIAWVLIISATTIIYFVLAAPLISVLRDAYQIKTYQASIATEIENANYSKALDESRNIGPVVKDAQERLSEIRYIFNIFNSDAQYLLIQKSLDNYTELYDGLQLSLDSLIPFENYLNAFQPNLTYRYAENTLLTVGNSTEYDQYLSTMKNKYNSFKIGVDKTTKAVDSLLTTYDSMPQYLRDLINVDKEKLTISKNQFNTIVEFYNYFPSLVGYQQTRNFLFIIQDNSRYSASGGEIAGYIVVQMRNGAIKEIRIRNASTIASKLISISPDAADEINLLAGEEKNTGNITFSDLLYISNQKIFITEAQNAISREENLKIDMAVVVNLKYLEELISVYGNYNYRDTAFTRENILDKINESIGVSGTAQQRNDVIMNLFAIGVEKSMNGFGDSFNDLSSATSSAEAEYNFRFYSTDPLFSNLDDASQIFMDYSKADYLYAGTNYNNINNLQNKYQTNTITGNIVMAADNSVRKSIELTASATTDLKNSYVCIPPGSKEVQLNDITDDIVSRTFSNDKVCYTFLKGQEQKYEMGYGSLPFAVGASDNIYKFVIYTNPGISTNYDLSFDFADSLGSVQPFNDDYIMQEGKFVYTGRSTGVIEFAFKIIKNG